VRDANIGCFHNVLTAPKTAKLWEVLDVLEQRNLSGLPVVDEQNKVVGFYHRSDVSFIIKATDTDMVLANLSNFRVEESMALREQLLLSGEIMSSFQGLAVSRLSDPLSSVLLAMLRNRTSRAVVVNDQQQCAGVVSIKDIVRYYLAGQLGY
jgi:CBS domain-containing protein